jgi:hypothetical protein
MKIGYIAALFTIVVFTNCSREAVALNEYHPQENIKISSITAEVTAEDIASVKKRRDAYFSKLH